MSSGACAADWRSCSDWPVHAAAKPRGSCATSRSISAMAAPLETPGAAPPAMRAAGKPWKRIICWGDSVQTGVATSPSGTRPPAALRTRSFSTSPSCMRAGASACTMTCCMRPAFGKSLT